MKSIALMVCVVAGIAVVAAQQDPTVAVTGGQVRGAQLGGGAVFKGIPYAQPPIGGLRWREPTPVAPWSGVRDATGFGAICPQNPTFTVPNAQEISNEDCLFVNVWTAEWPSRAPKPVVVWFPGGGNLTGGTVEARYDGERLARRGVVVVTVNYRLGSFGFFAHPALSREGSTRTSGNQGLLDQIAALTWVCDNIGRFGQRAADVTTVVRVISPGHRRERAGDVGHQRRHSPVVVAGRRSKRVAGRDVDGVRLHVVARFARRARDRSFVGSAERSKC